MTSRRLRIGLPNGVADYPEHSSAARIWRQVRRILAQRHDVVVTDPHRRIRRTVDVWLTDGHQGALAVAEPVVAHFHEAAWDDDAVRSTTDAAFIDHYRALSAQAARAATRLLAVSESSRAQIIASYGIDPDRVHHVPNGVDLSQYRPRSDDRDLADLVGSSRPYVLFVGTVHPRKNLTVLRDAMAELARRGFDHGLVLVLGAAPDRADSARLWAAASSPIDERAVSVLSGLSDDDLARVMAGAAALCLPSLLEGFGMPVLEAMACGTPVVVADRGALPEVVGAAGVVVEPTVDGVADGLACVLGDSSVTRRLTREGLVRAQDFGWESVVRRWEQVLVRAADERPGRPVETAMSAPVRRLRIRLRDGI